MKILIYGGTGVVGSGIINAVKTDARFTADVISRHNPDIEQTHIRYIQGDANDVGFIKRLFEKNHYDVIIDLVKCTEQQFAKKLDLNLSATKHYVWTSSAAVYAPCDKPITEKSLRLYDLETEKYIYESEYRIEKLRMENMLCQSKYKHWTILRPHIIFDKNRIPLCGYERGAWLYRAMKGKKLVLPKECLDKKTSLLSSKEFGERVIRILGAEVAFGEVFNVASDYILTWGDILEMYSTYLKERYGIRVNVKYVDDTEKFIEAFGGWWSLKYDRLKDRIFNVQKMHSVCEQNISSCPYDDLKDCISKAYEDLINGLIYPLPIENAYMDRISKSRTSLDEFQRGKDRIKYFLYRNVYSVKQYYKLIGVAKKIGRRAI